MPLFGFGGRGGYAAITNDDNPELKKTRELYGSCDYYDKIKDYLELFANFINQHGDKKNASELAAVFVGNQLFMEMVYGTAEVLLKSKEAEGSILEDFAEKAGMSPEEAAVILATREIKDLYVSPSIPEHEDIQKESAKVDTYLSNHPEYKSTLQLNHAILEQVPTHTTKQTR